MSNTTRRRFQTPRSSEASPNENTTRVYRNSSSSSTTATSSFFNSIICWAFGLIIIIFSSIFLYKNELSSINTVHVLSHAKKNVLSLGAANTDSVYNPDIHQNCLIHFTSKLRVETAPNDNLFNVQGEGCVKLKRIVEMYQWREDTTSGKDSDGNEYTDYTYSKTWSSHAISSTSFATTYGHENPEMAVQSTEFQANGVSLLDTQVTLANPTFLDQITWDSPAMDPNWQQFTNNLYPDLPIAGSKHLPPPEIGSYRIKWQCVGADNDIVSIMGMINVNHLDVWSYHIEDYPSIGLLERGSLDSNSMVSRAQRKVSFTTWLYRFGLTFLTMVGFVMAWEPVNSMFRKVPFLGSLMANGVIIIAVLLAVTWSTLVIAVSWVIVRPWLVMSALLVLVVTWSGLWKKYKLSRPVQTGHENNTDTPPHTGHENNTDTPPPPYAPSGGIPAAGTFQ